MPNPNQPEAKFFPKILFVHDYRPDSLVTADLLRQLFLGYPATRIAWWYCREAELHARPSVQADSLHPFGMPERLIPNVRQTALKSWLLEQFWVPRAARHLERTLAEVQPDLVGGLLYGWSVPVLARVRWPAGQPRHFSLWDLPDTNGMKKKLGAERSRRFLEAIYELIRRADSFDAICPGALKEIRLHTGRSDGLVVHSGFEPQHLAALENAPADPAPDGVIRIAYVGTINYETQFAAVIAALKKACARTPRKIALEFFGGRHYRSRAWFEPDWMTEHGLFTDEGLVEALRRCVWGLVAMDPQGKDLRGSQFSFPNKVGTYLSAGVPVLGLGNPKSSLVHIMQTYRMGRYTCATDPAEMEKFFGECLQMSNPRGEFRADILKCARTEFDAAAMRERLWRLWGVRCSEI